MGGGGGGGEGEAGDSQTGIWKGARGLEGQDNIIQDENLGNNVSALRKANTVWYCYFL